MVGHDLPVTQNRAQKILPGDLEAYFAGNICRAPGALIGPVTSEGTGSLPVHLVIRLLVGRI
jgi:hypothetical protein